MTKAIRILLIVVLGIIAFWLVLWTLAFLNSAGSQSNNAQTQIVRMA